MKNLKFPWLIGLIFFVLQVEGQHVKPDIKTIFPVGDKIVSDNFHGEPWVLRMFSADSTFSSSVGNVIFEPQTRSNWHKHPGGQILLALNGIGYYQEKGKELKILRPGDTVKCPPNVEHWHGASHDDWFVQLAITEDHPDGRVIWLNPVSDEAYQAGYLKAYSQIMLTSLSNRHHHFVLISSFTAKGDLIKLETALTNALNDGLTVNEIKEVLLHLYAYCGFPRSIQGLITFLSVVNERKEKGIVDTEGDSASEIDESAAKYERGRKVLEELVGTPISKPTVGYGAFSPEIDTFLKEHLFADIFERDVLSYKDREIATISALVNLGGVDRMIRGHLGIALNIGISETQLYELLSVIKTYVGSATSEPERKIFTEVLNE